MGQSVEAHVGFGWPLSEDACAWAPGHEACQYNTEYEYWTCAVSGDEDEEAEDIDLYEVFDEHPVLELCYDGSVYSSSGRVLVLRGTEVSTDWKAAPLVLADIPADAEATMRAEVEKLGLRLPAEPPTWLLWPLEG